MASVTAWCPVTSSCDKLLKALLSFPSRPTENGVPVVGISFQQAGYIVKSMRFLNVSPTRKMLQPLHPDTMNVSKQLEKAQFAPCFQHPNVST